MDKYESKHNKLGEKIAALVAAIYNQSILEFCQTAELSNYDGEGYFSFDDMPLTKAIANKLTKTVASNIQATIVNGLTASWNIAEQKNDALVNSLFKGETLTDEQKIRYFQNNEPALKAFINRRTNGMRLSDRVWKYTNDYKNEIEDAISVSIGEGKSAHSLAKEVQQYLQQPDKLFRRVRDEKGNLHLSNNAKNYHPGRGVYRSSYQNAKRLARTEINMAYRTADYTRIQQFDFVVGIEIKTSSNHPEHDICDQLQGRYPKDFKFTGWHPNCRCYTKTILKTDEEMDRDEERMRKGQEPLVNSKNSVNDVPEEFKEWTADNEEKISDGIADNKAPYFINDNKKYVLKVISGDEPKEIESANTASFWEYLKEQTKQKIYPKTVSSFSYTDTKFDISDFISGIKGNPTNENVHQIVGMICNNNKSYFKGNLDTITTMYYYEGNACVQWDEGKWHSLIISTKTINGFNLSDELKNAIKAIRDGKELNFNQEYSFESLYHELLHSQSIGWNKDTKAEEINGALGAVMETLNQFISRRQYQSFIMKHFSNAKLNPEIHSKILTDGYGYYHQLKYLSDLLAECGISEEKLFSEFKDKIKMNYNTLYGDLKKFIRRNQKTKFTDNQIEEKLNKFIDEHFLESAYKI